MRRTFMLMALAAVSAPVWGDAWEYPLQPSLYSVTFAGYADGEKLSDKGATGGKWTDIPETAMARAAVLGGRETPAMEYATLSDVVFGVTNQGAQGAKALRIAAWVTAFELPVGEVPALDNTKDKFAFSMCAPSGGKPSFIGWSKDGWQKLHLASGKVEPKSGAWYELSVWMVTGLEGVISVQYRLWVGDGYEPLLNESDTGWLAAGGPAATGSTIQNVVFRGEGGFDAMAGKDIPPPGLSVHFH